MNMPGHAPRILVTGGTGFLGASLLEQLTSAGNPIAATFRSAPDSAAVVWIRAASPGAFRDAVEQWRPDAIIHCLFPPPTGDEPSYMALVASIHEELFDACERLPATMVLAGSSAVYAPVATPSVLTEDARIGPVTMYGRAKAAVEALAAAHSRERGLRYTVARLFNLIGPGQRAGMLLPDWMAQFAAVLDGGATRLHVRALDRARDFVDVRDAAAALITLVAREGTGEVFNICSGDAVSLRDLLDELRRITGVASPVEIAEPASHASDVSWQRGSFARAAEAFNWRPRRAWRESVRDAWAEMRSAAAKGSER